MSALDHPRNPRERARRRAPRAAWYLAGAFLATGLGSLGLASCKDKPFAVQVVFPEAGGLKPGDNVTVRGLSIGQVADLDLHPDGVVARLEIAPRFVAGLDAAMTVQIADEKLVTGKRMVVVVPGVPPGAPLTAGALIKGAAMAAGPLEQARAVLSEGVGEAEAALDRTVKRASAEVSAAGRDLLNPDVRPPRAVGGTVDLDRPGNFRLRLEAVRVESTTADGSDWDGAGAGDPDLLVQVWADDRQVYLSTTAEDVLETEFTDAVSAPFELGPETRLRVKVLDVDVGFNDEIGVVELSPAAADVGRTFRLAAGRVAELRVTLLAGEVADAGPRPSMWPLGPGR